MTTVFAILIISVILLQPILLVTVVVRALLKKSIKKLGIAILICIGSIIPLTILGTITDPATWCEHEYEVIEDVAPTCTEKGRIVRLCSLCDSKDTEKLDTIAHAFEVVEDTASSCTESGKIVKKCSMCGS